MRIDLGHGEVFANSIFRNVVIHGKFTLIEIEKVLWMCRIYFGQERNCDPEMHSDLRDIGSRYCPDCGLLLEAVTHYTITNDLAEETGGFLLPRNAKFPAKGIKAWFYRLRNDERGWIFRNIYKEMSDKVKSEKANRSVS